MHAVSSVAACARAYKTPALKWSPAPIVSTTVTDAAGADACWTVPSDPMAAATHPLGPRLTTIVTPRVAAISRANASGVSLEPSAIFRRVANAMASSSLQNSTSTSRASRISSKTSIRDAITSKLAKSKEILEPQPLIDLIVSIMDGLYT